MGGGCTLIGMENKGEKTLLPKILGFPTDFGIEKLLCSLYVVYEGI